MLAKRDIQAPDYASAVVIGSVGNAHVRANWEGGGVLKVLAQCGVEGLAKRRSNSIRTCSEDQSGTFVRLSHDDKIGERTDLVCQWVVLHACRKPRVKTIGQSITPLRTVYLFCNDANSVGPLVVVLACPAHGAAFSRSKRSTWDG